MYFLDKTQPLAKSSTTSHLLWLRQAGQNGSVLGAGDGNIHSVFPLFI